MSNMSLSYVNGNVGTAAAVAVARDDDRKYIEQHNTHASQAIYAKFGATAASLEGHVVKAGEKLVFGDGGGPCPIDYLSVYGEGATTTYSVVQGY